MPTKYLILRSKTPVDHSFASSSPKAWGELRGGQAEVTIETTYGHETDVGELRADPRNVSVVDSEVVLSLIAPKSQASANVASLKPVGAIKMPDGLVAVKAHTAPFTGQGVTVAILDTGIDDAHPAFNGKTIVKKNFTDEGNGDDVTDTDGHGTHCAATICGAPVDGIRVGVAPGVVKLCVGKVLGPHGCTLEMLIRGLFWAVMEQKASVVSMSLGYDLPGDTERMIKKGMAPAHAAEVILRQQSDILKGIDTLKALLESRSPNVLFVAATGNESDRTRNSVLDAGLPARELFSVGAVGSKDDKWEIAPFSNGRANVVAPGVDIVSAAPGGKWAVMTGTSMATPHVAGVAALWTEKLRNQGGLIVPDTVRSAILSNAIRKPILDSDDLNAIGAGLVQAPQN